MHNIVGHETQKAILLNNTQVGTWLIHGRRGIGKATLSLAFARHLIGAEDLSSHPDVMVISDSSEGIGIDKARALRQFLHMTAIKSAYKVAIVDCIDDASINAANALLKIIEDPPKNSVIIIISHNLYQVPITIRSRCFLLCLSTLSCEDTRKVVSRNFPNLKLEEQISSLYPGTPGMITEEIGLELDLYKSFSAVMNSNSTSAIGEILETTLPLHKIEYILLTKLSRTICDLSTGATPIPPRKIINILDRYSKIREILQTSRKLHMDKGATLLQVINIVTDICL